MKIQNTALFFLCALLMLGVSCNKTEKNPQTAPYIFSNPTSYTYGKKYGGSGMYLYQVGREKGSGNWWTVTNSGSEAIYAVQIQSLDNEGQSAKLYLKNYENNLASGKAVRCVKEN